MNRLNQECREQKTRMGFCKIEGAAPSLLNPIRNTGFEQHAGVGLRAANFRRHLTSQKNHGAVHAVLCSTCTELTYAPTG